MLIAVQPELLFAHGYKFTGCFMSANTAPGCSSYRFRTQDFGARLELQATLAWLRENADRAGQLDALLDQRPETLKSPTRSVQIEEDGDSLHIRMFHDPGDESWSVPLPGALSR